MVSKNRLIDEHGQPQYGYFPKGVHDINYLDFDLRSPMDKVLSARAKRRKFNQFQFVGFTSPDLIVGVAIADLKIVSAAFCYFYEPKTQRYEECSFLQPLARNTECGQHPNADNTSFQSGKNRIEFKATQRSGVRQVSVQTNKGMALHATVDETTNYNPLAVCSRTGFNGWTYTQKTCARVCQGEVHWNGRVIQLETVNALACVDWTGGFMRRETSWNWGSLSCRLNDGRRLGFNLAAGVNETGFTENAVWLDDQLHHINGVDFRFDRFNHNNAWSMHSADKKIQLHFEPRGQRCERVNALIIASNFTQHFGQFYGDIVVGDEVIHLDGEWGFAEDHYAKW